MGIDLEKIKEAINGKVAIILICGALFIVSLLGGGKELARKADILPSNSEKTQVMQMDSEWTKDLTKLLPYNKSARFFKNTIQFIESERGAYRDITVLESNIGYLLKTIGLQDVKVYVKTHNVVSGNNILYDVDMISVFTESNQTKKLYSDLITQVLKDNIDGDFTVKVYGKLNTGK